MTERHLKLIFKCKHLLNFFFFLKIKWMHAKAEDNLKTIFFLGMLFRGEKARDNFETKQNEESQGLVRKWHDSFEEGHCKHIILRVANTKIWRKLRQIISQISEIRCVLRRRLHSKRRYSVIGKINWTFVSSLAN